MKEEEIEGDEEKKTNKQITPEIRTHTPHSFIYMKFVQSNCFCAKLFVCHNQLSCVLNFVCHSIIVMQRVNEECVYVCVLYVCIFFVKLQFKKKKIEKKKERAMSVCKILVYDFFALFFSFDSRF